MATGSIRITHTNGRQWWLCAGPTDPELPGSTVPDSCLVTASRPASTLKTPKTFSCYKSCPCTNWPVTESRPTWRSCRRSWIWSWWRSARRTPRGWWRQSPGGRATTARPSWPLSRRPPARPASSASSVFWVVCHFRTAKTTADCTCAISRSPTGSTPTSASTTGRLSDPSLSFRYTPRAPSKLRQTTFQTIELTFFCCPLLQNYSSEKQIFIDRCEISNKKRYFFNTIERNKLHVILRLTNEWL